VIEELTLTAARIEPSPLDPASAPTLTQFRALSANGDVIRLTSPFSGAIHEASLEPFAALDPMTTQVVVEWRYYGDAPPVLPGAPDPEIPQ